MCVYCVTEAEQRVSRLESQLAALQEERDSLRSENSELNNKVSTTDWAVFICYPYSCLTAFIKNASQNNNH